MKLILTLLITLAVCVGSLGAATAYLAPLDLPDEQLLGLTLNAPAGMKIKDGKPEPLAYPDMPITAELLKELRNNNVEYEGKTFTVKYVRVKSFSWSRWQGRHYFLMGCFGLALAAGLMKRQATRQLTSQGEVHETETPEYALRRMHEIVVELNGNADANEALIVERLSEVQKDHVPAFVDGKTRIIARHGQSGYADMMDRFAAAERQINRAWSAAADHVLDESRHCLAEAAVLLEETRRLLGDEPRSTASSEEDKTEKEVSDQGADAPRSPPEES